MESCLVAQVPRADGDGDDSLVRVPTAVGIHIFHTDSDVAGEGPGGVEAKAHDRGYLRRQPTYRLPRRRDRDKTLRRCSRHVYVARLGKAAVVESDNYEKRRAGNWGARRHLNRREGYMRSLTRRHEERAGAPGRGASLSRVVGV